MLTNYSYKLQTKLQLPTNIKVVTVKIVLHEGVDKLQLQTTNQSTVTQIKTRIVFYGLSAMKPRKEGAHFIPLSPIKGRPIRAPDCRRLGQVHILNPTHRGLTDL